MELFVGGVLFLEQWPGEFHGNLQIYKPLWGCLPGLKSRRFQLQAIIIVLVHFTLRYLMN